MKSAYRKKVVHIANNVGKGPDEEQEENKLRVLGTVIVTQVEEDQSATDWLDQVGNHFTASKTKIAVKGFEEGERLKRVDCST